MEKINSEIQSLPQVTVVEASAGSGKTYSLAKRYINLLTDTAVKSGRPPLREVLAITFTNKATIEMKERILELLKRVVFGAFEDKKQQEDILAVFKTGGQQAARLAESVVDELIKHYNFFQVQTIDSFINTLLLGCALNIGRSASFEIKRDYLEQLSYCLDLVIEQGAQSQQVLDFLEEFLKHYLFVENKKGWLPKEDILSLMKSLFKLSNKYGELFQAHEGKSVDIIKKKKNAYSLIQKLSQNLPEGLNANAAKSIKSFIENNNGVFSVSSLPAALAQPKVPLNKGRPACASFQKQWARLNKELIELVEFDSAVVYNPYIRLFSGLLGYFQGESKKKDVLFLEELNHKARSLFGNEGITVAELYYRLATRFKHYLIDEFQDTSLLQWHNLKIMVEEALASGGTLFYVGDKKQAIYRFRGGEAKLFDSLSRQFSIFNVETKRLSKNWRSHKAIVEFNNEVFSEANLKRALGAGGISLELDNDPQALSEVIDVFKEAAQEYKEENDSGYVKVEHIEEKNQSQRDEALRPKIINLLKSLKQRFKYGDVAILTRDNNEVELVSSWLLEAAIPVESEKTLNVAHNPLIKGVISFLKFLYSPIDDLSFAAFILSDLFCAKAGLSRQDITRFIFELRKAKALNGPSPLYRLFRRKYPQIWQDYIDEFFKSVGFVSPYELVVNFYARYNILENFSQAQAFFMKFLELVKIKEDEYPGLEEFLSYLEAAPGEELYVNVTHSDSVKVLTIHKSKGLEFGVVIMPFLRVDINPETGERGMSSYVVGDDSPGPLKLARITKNHRLYSEKLRQIYVQGYKKACIDELNNIYVALTRAKCELYVFIPKKSSAKNNQARFLIPEHLQELGSRKKYPEKEKLSQNLMELPALKHESLAEIFKDEAVDTAAVKNREKIILGSIFHLVLSGVGNLYGKDKSKVISRAVIAAKALYPHNTEFDSIETKLEKLVSNKEFEMFFYVPAGTVYNEKDIVNDYGDIKRIDRLIIKDSEAWIIDYKSSKEGRDKHHKQVAEYAQAIKDIYPRLGLKGFIIYLDEMVKEEVNF